MTYQTQIFLFLSLFLLTPLSRVTKAQEHAPTLREQLVGEWTAISVVSSGKKTAIPGERTQELTLKFTRKEFEGRELKAKQDKADKLKGTYSLDTDVQPATLDLIFGKTKEEKLVGIVRIEDGKLILCSDSLMGRLKRPSKFESPESSGFDLLVFKRVTRDEETRRTKP